MMDKVWDFISNFFRERKTKIGIVFIMIAVLLILVNIVFSAIENRYSLGTDITRNKLFTLSATSNQILGDLEEDIFIYAICSPGQEDTRIQELLKEYSAASSHIIVRDNIYSLASMPAEFSYPKNSSNGIMVTNTDNSYHRIFTFGDMYITDDEGNERSFVGENKLTAAIHGVSERNFVNIKLLTGHGETSYDEISTFTSMLDLKNYIVSTYDFATSSEKLNPKNDVLIIVSPKADLEQNEYDVLREYMSNGGSILAFVDRTSFNTKQGVMQRYASELPLFKQLLASYSLHMNDDVIVAATGETLNMRKTSINALVVRDGEENEVEQRVILNEASSIEIIERAGRVRVILKTDNNCNSYVVDDNIEQNVARLEAGHNSYIVGAVSTLNDSKVILITDSSCISNDTLQINGNYSFFSGVISELVPVNQPVSLPSKNMDNIVVRNRTKVITQILSYVILLIIISVPAMLVYFGFTMDRKRKSKR